MRNLFALILLLSGSLLVQAQQENQSNPPIYIAFLWHMHQPLYWPGETILETEANNYYPYSVFDIHNQRTGPYTNWPAMAVQKGIDANLPHAGASVSFTGSLIENLNHLEDNGNGNFQNWAANWNTVINQTTSLGNPRMDMIGFGYYHPLMGLISNDDIRAHLQKHKQILAETFDGNYSKGIFPPENAFSMDMIPALQDEGIEWALVDNIHFERAADGYPFSTAGNLYEPNKADARNPDPGDWVQLTDLWAPTKISAQWAHQPHYVEYVDPETGEISRIIAVPTSRYLGNEDGRGGFGALQYEQVMSQLEPYNTDPDHPILIVLHHDGDNYGGGSEGYYNGNFQAFVDWAAANPDRFVPTTIQDYLDLFPPEQNDVIHIESGSWAGADNGDPEFKKWLGDPGTDGYSPDRNSWGVITAAKNYVDQAREMSPNNEYTTQAHTYLLNAQASDYWYWDNSIDGIWDTHPTTASNLAIQAAQNVIAQRTGDTTPPSIFKPQREPYNPGGTEWGIPQSSAFTVWTYAFDVSGLESVRLKYRAMGDDFANRTTGFDQIDESDTSWKSLDMTGISITPKTNVEPIEKALEYSAEISGMTNTFVEYFVEATDQLQNTSRSLIQYVWVGTSTNGGGTGGQTSVTISPKNPTKEDPISITISGATQNAKLHWGINNSGSIWATPNEVYWPENTALFNGNGPAVETDFSFDADSGLLSLSIGPFNAAEQAVDRVNFVIHYEDDSWDNNNGQDFLIDFGTTSGGNENHDFVMDGELDASATLMSSNNGLDLYLDFQYPFLYVATESATSGEGDRFIFISDEAGNLTSSPWAKAGQVASWDAFLANENTNNYQSWFDHSGSAESSAGNYLEGVINLETEYGVSLPPTLYLALAEFGTNDNGNLLHQTPAGNDDGNLDANELFAFSYVLTSTEELPAPIQDFTLLQNYPNPFNPSTVISYQLPVSSGVKLEIFDMLGRALSILEHGRKSAGSHSAIFNGTGLSSGVYFYQLSVNGTVVDTRRMLLMK